jgi:hypothetical protein
MRRAIWALAIFGSASMGVLPAASRDYPFCIKGCDYGAGLGDCSFSSYQQCQATVSGRVGYCDINPYFNGKAELQVDRSRMSRRRY